MTTPSYSQANILFSLKVVVRLRNDLDLSRPIAYSRHIFKFFSASQLLAVSLSTLFFQLPQEDLSPPFLAHKLHVDSDNNR